MSDPAEPVDFFSDGSPYLSHPLLTAERSATEIDQIEKLTGSVTGRVLDIGCGFGRHSIELAARGADVTGVDPSMAMIAEARARATAAGQFVDFACLGAADVRDVARYDLAICLFTTFGQLDRSTTNDTPHIRLLQQSRQALRPGGTLVIELPDKDRAVPALVQAEQLGPTRVTRRFDAGPSILSERFELENGLVYLLRYRLFDTTELADMVHDAGFEIQHMLHHGLVEPPTIMNTLVATRPS